MMRTVFIPFPPPSNRLDQSKWTLNARIIGSVSQCEKFKFQGLKNTIDGNIWCRDFQGPWRLLYTIPYTHLGYTLFEKYMSILVAPNYMAENITLFLNTNSTWHVVAAWFSIDLFQLTVTHKQCVREIRGWGTVKGLGSSSCLVTN